MVGDIGHELPTNLLGMDGPKRWWNSFASCSFEDTFWETIFLVEGYLLFCLPFFWFFWLIVTWCIVLLLHPLPSVLLGLFVPTAFSVSWLRHKSWGGVRLGLYLATSIAGSFF